MKESEEISGKYVEIRRKDEEIRRKYVENMKKYEGIIQEISLPYTGRGTWKIPNSLLYIGRGTW